MFSASRIFYWLSSVCHFVTIFSPVVAVLGSLSSFILLRAAGREVSIVTVKSSLSDLA